MAYLSLYRKYRPQTFSEILGQAHVSTTLAHAIEEDRVAHAYLFTGPRGTGKTSTARILAKALNCEKGPTPEPCGKCTSCVAIAEGSSLDVIEMDAASHSKVEETRDILAGVPLATAGGKRKVYVIDEVHMLTTQSFNALLKTLEEPPEHVVFVLATTEAHKVLSTIVSRTQRFDFRRVSADIIEGHVADVAKQENIDIDPDAVAAIARHCEGSVRDALSSLDQLRSIGGQVSLDDAERLLGERREAALVELFDAISEGDVGRVLAVVDVQISQGADPRQFALGALGHARSLLLLATSPGAGSLIDVSSEDRDALAAQAEKFSVAGLLRGLDLLATAITDMRNAPNHRLLFEVAVVRSAAPETDPTSAGLLGRIERLERRLAIGDPSDAPAPTSPPTPSSRASKQGGKPRRAASAEASSGAGERSPEPVKAASSPGSAKAEARDEEGVRPSAPSPSTPSTEHVGLGHVRDAWAATLKEVNAISRRVGAFLNPSQPVKLEDEVLTVEVQSLFHKEAMSEERNRQALSDALFAALGVRYRPAFVERGATPEPAVAPEEEPKSAAAALADAETIEEDPVDLVVKGLGAEIVEEKEL